LRKEEITSKSQLQVKPVRIQSKIIQASRTYASVTIIESSQSIHVKFTWLDKGKTTSSAGQLEKFMQEFQNAIKEFTMIECAN